MVPDSQENWIPHNQNHRLQKVCTDVFDIKIITKVYNKPSLFEVMKQSKYKMATYGNMGTNQIVSLLLTIVLKFLLSISFTW